MSQPVLLCYNLSAQAAAKYALAAMRLKIRLRAVKPEEFSLPLSALLGAAQEQSADPEEAPFSDPMLVMANFPAGMMNTFLAAAQRIGAPRIPLKAILTPTNAAWSSQQLHEEIRAEHEAMSAGKGQRH